MVQTPYINTAQMPIYYICNGCKMLCKPYSGESGHKKISENLMIQILIKTLQLKLRQT